MFETKKDDSGTSNTVASEEMVTLYPKIKGKDYPKARDLNTDHDDFYGDGGYDDRFNREMK